MTRISHPLVIVLNLVLLFFASSVLSIAQDEAGKPVEKIEGSHLSTGLHAVVESFRALREQQQDIAARLKALESAAEPNQEAIENNKAAQVKVKESLEKVKLRIKEVAAGVEATTKEPAEEAFNLNNEFNNLAKPLVDELKEASKDARAISELRASVSQQERRKRTLEISLERVEKEKVGIKDQDVLEILDNLQNQINSELSIVRATLATEELRLQKRLSVQQSWTDQLMDSVLDFIKGRGLILLLALFTGLITFFSLAFVHRKLFSRVGKGGKIGSSVSFRITELIFIVFRAIATVAIVVMLFLAFDDWLLITIVIILIIGLLWGAKKALVKGYGKLQLLLNLGQVRQGERVTWNGLPYEVRSLGVFPLLENPWLTNSTVRITIDELADLRMRDVTENEAWFVTETDDWVILSDGTYGKINYQSPERVCIQDPGGHTKTIPTEDYLGLNPTNLSNGYALATTFGIDYSHQSLDYEMVAKTFAASSRLKVLEHSSEEEVKVVFASFKEANSSSLDYIVVAKLAGSTADRRLPLARALQKGCLDACNQNGWIIPFPQLTINTTSHIQ